MFHAASAALLALGIPVDNHGALRTMFGLHLVKTGFVDKRFGRLLGRLKDERENGDYDIYSDFEPQDARAAIDDAAEFVGEMKRFLSERHGLAFNGSS